MPVYQGTAYTKTFQLKQAADDTPVDITGWTLQLQVRDNVNDTDALVDLDTDNGGIVILDAEAGRFEIIFSAANTAAMNLGKMVFDMLRTDADPGPVWIMGGRFQVKKPVTRDG
jgi:hypothetical protein